MGRMPLAVVDLEQIWIEGSELPAGQGRLLVERRDPLPGLPGTWRWFVTASSAGPHLVEALARQPARFRARTAAGLELSGLVTATRVRLGEQLVEGLQLDGVGSLAGFDESLLG
jgi:hypothetical protein